MGKFFKIIKKNLSAILIVAILLPLVVAISPPEKTNTAHAALATEASNLEIAANTLAAVKPTAVSAAADSVTAKRQNDDWIMKWIINPLADAAAAALIWTMFDSINSWIKNGFDGSPLFVTDWEGFLRKVGNEAFGIYVDKLIEKGAPDICSPFRIDVIIGLVSVSRPHAVCTLDRFIENVESIYEDFERYGWTGFIGITTANVSNNAFGSILLQMDQTQRAILEKATGLKLESQASGGFLSWKKCKGPLAFSEAASSECPAGYETVTPGSYVKDKLDLGDKYTATRLAVAKGIDGLISALAQQLIQMGLNALRPGGLAGTDTPDTPTYTPTFGSPSDPLETQRQRIRDTLSQNIITQENQYQNIKRQSANRLEETLEILQKIETCDQQQSKQSQIQATKNQLAVVNAEIQDSQRRIENIGAIIADTNSAETPQELTNVTFRMTSALDNAIDTRTIINAEQERDDVTENLNSVKSEFQQVEDNLLAQGLQCEPAPDDFLTVTESSIIAGESSAISWVPPAGTAKCVASDGWEGEKDPEGGLAAVSPTITTTYTLRCTNDDLSSFTSSSVTITVTSQ